MLFIGFVVVDVVAFVLLVGFVVVDVVAVAVVALFSVYWFCCC